MMYFILTFFFGLSVGSFVNVLIDRTMSGGNWVSGRSRCDYCKQSLTWYDMIPLLSYLYYRGYSRCCHKPLTIKHPLVESLFGFLFVWWLMVGFVFFQLATAPLTLVQPLFWLVIGIILTILALADLFHGVILMGLVWLGIGWVIIYRVVLVLFGIYQPRDLFLMMLAGGLSYLFLWLLRVITKGRGMGDGDPYLILLTTMMVGWQRAGTAVLSAFVVGAGIGILLIVTGMRKRKDAVPFGPFIIVGAAIALLWGEQISGFLFLR